MKKRFDRAATRRFTCHRGGLVTLALCLLTSVFCLPAVGQYSIDWFTIDGGGSTSTGGVYSVSGTIGQPDASGPLSGGNFSVSGGYWSLFAVQTPGAPLLRIRLMNPTTAAISWPSSSTGYQLQFNGNLNTTNWTNVAAAPADDGTNKTLNVSPPVGYQFYRLRKPWSE